MERQIAESDTLLFISKLVGYVAERVSNQTFDTDKDHRIRGIRTILSLIAEDESRVTDLESREMRKPLRVGSAEKLLP